MHGLIHIVVRRLAHELGDARTWPSVLRALELVSDDALMELRQYDDSDTCRVVNTLAVELGMPLDETLRALGRSFVRFLHVTDNLRALRQFGGDMVSLLNNINALHHSIGRSSFRQSSFPAISVGRSADDELRISYVSVRGATLVPLVEGALAEVGALMYGVCLHMKRASVAEHGFCATWDVKVSEGGGGECAHNLPPLSDQDKRAATCWHIALAAKEAEAPPAPVLPPGPAAAAADAARASVSDASFSEAGEERQGSSCRRGGRQGRLWGCALDADTVHDPAANTSNGSLPPAPPGPTPFAPVRDTSLSFGQRETARLDELATRIDKMADPAAALMRAVPAREVAASWLEPDMLEMAEAFWASREGAMQHYALSVPTERAHCFVSHEWHPPADWDEKMGANCSYAAIKAVALASAVQDIALALREAAEAAAGPGQPQRAARKSRKSLPKPPRRPDERPPLDAPDFSPTLAGVSCWIDKNCCPQSHALTPRALGLLHEFVKRCDEMVVLMTWGYFSRLWCLYEWCLVLVFHDARRVRLCADHFMRASTLQLYVDAVRRLRVADARCTDEADRATLLAKIRELYVSEAAFEAFAQSSAIALIAVSACQHAGHGWRVRTTHFDPWPCLADELGLSELAAALRCADPVRWQREAVNGERDEPSTPASALGTTAAWRRRYDARVDAWYARSVAPVLAEVRARCVRKEFLHAHAARARRSSGAELPVGSYLSASSLSSASTRRSGASWRAEQRGSGGGSGGGSAPSPNLPLSERLASFRSMRSPPMGSPERRGGSALASSWSKGPKSPAGHQLSGLPSAFASATPARPLGARAKTLFARYDAPADGADRRSPMGFRVPRTLTYIPSPSPEKQAMRVGS